MRARSNGGTEVVRRSLEACGARFGWMFFVVLDASK
jgi:hypothetical protein